MGNLTAICGVCLARVTPGGGALWADMGELPDNPHVGIAPWRVSHYGCIGPLDVRTYAIDVEEAADPARLLWWTAHLSEKSWLRLTDWMGVIRRAGESGRLEGRRGLPSGLEGR